MPLPPHNDRMAGPWMRIESIHILDDARSERIEVDIAGELQEISPVYQRAGRQARFPNYSTECGCRKLCRKIVASSARLFHPVSELVGRRFRNQQSHGHHGLQVPLQGPAVDIGAQALEVLDGQAAVLQDVAEGLGLAL